jgi:predicted enzyme related to lactoylglutathione lyase
MPAIATFSLVALDCPDHRSLAEFYAAITGWEVGHVDDDWAQLTSDGGATIAFQKAPGHVAPDWPSDAHPQQLHIDFDVDDLDVGEAQVLALGARKAEVQPGQTFRVYLDPAGHPFCLVLANRGDPPDADG